METNKKSNTSLQVQKKSPVMQAYELLTKELESLETLESTPFKTGNRSITIGPSSYNIQEIDDVGTLISLAGKVVHTKAMYDSGIEALDFEDREKIPECGINGCLPADIIYDLNLRKQIVTMEERRSKIKDKLSRLQSRFDKEDKDRLLFKEINDDLGIDLSDELDIEIVPADE